MSKLGDAVAKKLKHFRLDRSETQDWLADTLGLSRATINRWEGKGAATATLEDIELIAEVLKITPAELLDLRAEIKIEKVELPKDQWEAILEYIELTTHRPIKKNG